MYSSTDTITAHFEISHTALSEKSQEATLCAAGNPTEDRAQVPRPNVRTQHFEFGVSDSRNFFNHETDSWAANSQLVEKAILSGSECSMSA